MILSIQDISLAEDDAPSGIDKAMPALQPSEVIELTVLRGNRQMTLRKVGYELQGECPVCRELKRTAVQGARRVNSQEV